MRNRDLAEVTSADDVTISERLVALALTQITLNKAAFAVFAGLLSPNAAEIYLKPAREYATLDKSVNFYTVFESARRMGQSAIGYRLLAEASDADKPFGVHLNLEKSTSLRFTEQDRIIVLAET